MRIFERYCKDYENIENYEAAKADNFKNWDCHHRLETHNSDGERRLVDITIDELKALDMYYNRPASELVFLTRREHMSLHNKGKHPSEETRKKLSEAKKGKQKSEETRKKISDANKGKPMSEETRKKIAEARKGKYIGKDSSFYGKHHSEETKKKMSEANKGYHWFNNGKINKRANECPPGFVPGMLK